MMSAFLARNRFGNKTIEKLSGAGSGNASKCIDTKPNIFNDCCFKRLHVGDFICRFNAAGTLALTLSTLLKI
jgi:hypothetical protein